MQQYRADFHIHTLLSPCGDLEMSPVNIVERASQLGLHIIGITDHNSTRHAPLIQNIAASKGIFTLCGAEVTTKEEAHCLAFFEDLGQLKEFQQYLDTNLPDIKNDPKYFGHQVVIDEQEMIVEEVDKLLISALSQSLNQIERKVHELNGIFIPAHIDKQKFSLVSQLGFVPPDLKVEAFELSRHTSLEAWLKKFPYLSKSTFIRSSDAHHPDQMGSGATILEMEKISFSEIKMALQGIDGRRVVLMEK